MFHFKQFSVDQTGCAMKINTDGVLLGAMAGAGTPLSVLDIGTGTGVIALMLAQRFTGAEIDAIEIDETAAETAKNNFTNSPFAGRLKLYPTGFEAFFECYSEKKYDLIVSNPPFYINSLQSPGKKKNLARHTDVDFFERLIEKMPVHLKQNGKCWLILPAETALEVKKLAARYGIYSEKIISIYSFANGGPHREILVFNKIDTAAADEKFVIYDRPKIYSKEYQELLKPFLTIF